MKFCWKRFRHFVVAYFALGIAATATHGTLVFMTVDDMVDDGSSSTVISDIMAPILEILPDIAEETPATPKVTITEEVATEEATTDSTVAVEESPVEAEISEIPVTEEVVNGSSEDTPTEVVAVEGSDSAAVDPSMPADLLEEGATAEPETSEDAPTSISDSSEGLEPLVEEPTNDTSLPETEVEMPVDTEPEVIAELPVEEELVDSWPEVRLDTDAIVIEVISPYSEARSILEAATPMLDWLYTLRSTARYTDIATTKAQTVIDTNEVIEVLESNGTDARINASFCDVDLALNQLTTLLAPGSDDTQPDVDAQNTQIINDIRSAVVQVRSTWVIVSGSTYQCSGN